MGVMTSSIRKLALTAHVTASVGWLGAIAAFLALAVAALLSDDLAIVRASAVGMQVTTWAVIVPLAITSLLTGLIVSLGTPWGLFRHYWVLVKLVLTLFATLLLVLHTQPIGLLARTAREATVLGADLRRLDLRVTGDAALAVVALLVSVTLSVYKPRGVTPYGWRRLAGPGTVGDVGDATVRPRWVAPLAIAVVVLVMVFRLVIVHLTGGGGHGHMGLGR